MALQHSVNVRPRDIHKLQWKGPDALHCCLRWKANTLGHLKLLVQKSTLIGCPASKARALLTGVALVDSISRECSD